MSTVPNCRAMIELVSGLEHVDEANNLVSFPRTDVEFRATRRIQTFENVLPTDYQLDKYDLRAWSSIQRLYVYNRPESKAGVIVEFATWTEGHTASTVDTHWPIIQPGQSILISSIYPGSAIFVNKAFAEDYEDCSICIEGASAVYDIVILGT